MQIPLSPHAIGGKVDSRKSFHMTSADSEVSLVPPCQVLFNGLLTLSSTGQSKGRHLNHLEPLGKLAAQIN